MMRGNLVGAAQNDRQKDGAMAGQAGLVYGSAMVLLLTAAYCATRPITSRLLGRRFEADVDAMHVVMGPAMAAMLVGRLGAGWSRAVAVGCVAGVVWFGSRTVRDGLRPGPGGGRPGHQAQHLATCAAMLYMVRGSPVSMSGMSSGKSLATGPAMSSAVSSSAPFQILAVGLGAVLIAYALWDICATVPSTGKGGMVMPSTGPRRMLAPRVAGGCQALMGLAMAAMVMATV
jgi:Domain of unknown function (DUF5134)